MDAMNISVQEQKLPTMNGMAASPDKINCASVPGSEFPYGKYSVLNASGKW